MADQKTFPWIGEDLLTVSDAARELGLSAQMVRFLCDNGKLEHMLITRKRHRVFTPAAVERCKQNREETARLVEEARALSAKYTVRYATAARRSE